MPCAAPYQKDKKIAQTIASQKGIPCVKPARFVLGGGSVELDGNRVDLLCKSSVCSTHRNSAMDIADVEGYLAQYLGVTNCIWLQGVVGEDITDAHIDGIARFFRKDTIISVSYDDFIDLYEGSKDEDYKVLENARNKEGTLYKRVNLPMTSAPVEGLEYKGSYLNYYEGNEVVLVPIDVRKLYAYGVCCIASHSNNHYKREISFNYTTLNIALQK